MAEKIFNVGIIGYGLSAKVFHIPLIAAVPRLKLYAIVQRSPEADDDAGKDHPGIRSYRSSEDMVKDGAVDIVVITTTPQTHFELTKLVLESGKHAVVEKPFTVTSKEAEELSLIARRNDRLLTVYQNRRWDADFLTLSKLIKNETLGRVAEFETHFDRHRPEASQSESWKTKQGPGGGVVYDLATHLVDQVLVLYGMPKRITGFVLTQQEGALDGREDTCLVLLHYDGWQAVVKAGVVSPEEEQLRYWVKGTKGSFKKFHMDCQEDQLKQGMKPGDEGFGVEAEDRHGTLTLVEKGVISSKPHPTVNPETYSAFYEQLAKALAGQGNVPVTAEEGINVIRLVELARESAYEGKTLDVR